MNIVLIDAKYLLYVQHFAHKDLTNMEGSPTGGIYGFLKEMFRMNEAWPAHPIFVWDGPGPSWKKGAHTGYKANRESTPDVKKVQLQANILRDLLHDVGFNSICIPSVEADDLIGILAKANWPKDTQIRIYSGDKDMYQLVSDNCLVWKKRYRKGQKSDELFTINAAMVQKEMGVLPKDLCEIRALSGDPSDNLKGLPGIGPNKARGLYELGFRPSRPWCEQPTSSAQRKLQWEWERINLEYALMLIPTTSHSKRFTGELAIEISRIVADCIENPGRRNRPKDSLTWNLYLAGNQMEDVWRDRQKLWEISSKNTP